MPKVNLARYAQKKEPPIDWLLAAILERKVVHGYDWKKMSEIGGCSYEYMRHLARTPTRDWPYNVLMNICKEFNISLKVSVDGSTPWEEIAE